MGSEASKPMAETRNDWEPRGGTKSFEVISPCSDLSNPSDFNRVRYNRHSNRYQLEAPGQSKSLPRNNDSRNKKSGDYNPHALPVAVKMRTSHGTKGSNRDHIVAPGAFYLPTKESERRVDRLAKKEFRTEYNVAKNIGNNQIRGARGNKIKTKNFRSLARRAAKKLKKRKDAVKRVAVAVGHACLEETRNKMILDKDMRLTFHRRPIAELEASRRGMDRKHSGSLRSRRRSEQIALGEVQASVHRRDVPLSKFKKDFDQKKNDNMARRKNRAENKENHQNQMDRLTSVALHQADAYFERLSLSANEDHGVSPFVNRGAASGAGNRVTSILENIPQNSPVNLTRKHSNDSPIDTPVSDLFSANDSIPQNRDQDDLISSMKNNNTSPVSSLMLFYTKSGPMESSPNSYYSEGDESRMKVFSDEQSNESSKKKFISQTSQEQNHGRQSQESNSSLYTTESKIYRKANPKSVKVLGYGNPNDRSDVFSSRTLANQKKEKSTKQKKNEGKPKVSKLESLFRPILPALSTDDAQSQQSYDPYEIKVTESAPGAMQGSKYIALGFRSSAPRKANDDSPSMSRLSIDSQQESSPNLTNRMVSNQAEHNGEFLFTDDYGPVVVAKNPDKARDAGLYISTAGARSRLTQKSTQKGVTIPKKNLEQEGDDVSFGSRSNKSGRRVRFSEGSGRSIPKKDGELSEVEADLFDSSENISGILRQEGDDLEEIDDTSEGPDIDEKPHVRFNVKPHHMKFHKFGPKISKVDSVDESIDLPDIESQPSDESEATRDQNRKSLESARSIETYRTIPDSVPEEDEKTEVSPDSVHWTKTENGVTPFVHGKSSANPTKSPFFRYQDAKTKFNSQDILVPKTSHETSKSTKKSPKNSPKKSPKKSPARVLRKGSGGLVSMRIQELNTRVSEVRKMKRMRKKMTNPRLHTHNFDNTQPVRSRALMNYKTKFGSANIENSNNVMAAKFNMIPDIDVDDDDSTTYSPETNENYFSSGKEDIEDDNVSRMSEITGATIATVRQERGFSTCSMNSRTTASSGFTNLKKQVFRSSDGARSIESKCDSATISTMVHKENENCLPFRATTMVKPTEQHFAAPPPTLFVPPDKGTPAMKWRTLAAAAAEKDALEATRSKPRKKLGTRSINCEPYHAGY